MSISCKSNQSIQCHVKSFLFICFIETFELSGQISPFLHQPQCTCENFIFWTDNFYSLFHLFAIYCIIVLYMGIHYREYSIKDNAFFCLLQQKMNIKNDHILICLKICILSSCFHLQGNFTQNINNNITVKPGIEKYKSE